jgi:hypothetical protein
MPLNFTWEMQLEPSDWNTGFYYQQANAIAIRAHHETMELYDRLVRMPDQEAYNRWILAYRLLRAPELRQHLFPLSRTLFPNGEGAHYGSAQGVIQHCNWVESAEKKRSRMREKGLWIYNKQETDSRLQQAQSKTTTDSLLQCTECEACKRMQPSAPPLRKQWPGELTVTDLGPYRGDDPHRPIRR